MKLILTKYSSTSSDQTFKLRFNNNDNNNDTTITTTITITVTKPQHTIQHTLPYQQEAKKTSTRHLRTRHITKQKNHKSIGHCLHKTQHKTVYSINIKTYYPGKIINLAYANQLVS